MEQAGLPVGEGLSKRAAEELGLWEGCAVGSGVIDACPFPSSSSSSSCLLLG